MRKSGNIAILLLCIFLLKCGPSLDEIRYREEADSAEAIAAQKRWAAGKAEDESGKKDSEKQYERYIAERDTALLLKSTGKYFLAAKLFNEFKNKVHIVSNEQSSPAGPWPLNDTDFISYLLIRLVLETVFNSALILLKKHIKIFSQRLINEMRARSSMKRIEIY